MDYMNEVFKNVEVYQNGQLIYYQHNQPGKEENHLIDDLIAKFDFSLQKTQTNNQIIDQFSQMNFQDN
ncbi:unnamed protein product [Paramecium primaurelia]|uniref:Uncharacterized protein n=1 Tax=Paramecium primaurelia TaxID=5886 RepID=A0A8S1NP98_PARPR|nr:unnamed protein product [Paramecium primaurelia]